MEAVPPVRSSLLGILLLVMKLSVLVSRGGGQSWGTNPALHSYLTVVGPGNLSLPVELADCLPPDVI